MQQEPTPEMPPFSPAVWRGPAGAPSPISSRPPAPGQQQQMVAAAAAAARDAAVVSFIHRVTGQMAVLPPPPPETKTATKAAMLKRPPPAPPLQPTTPRNQPQQPHVVMPMSAPASASAPARAETSPAQSNEVVAVGGVDTAAAASRWPKAEVHALIELRTEMEARYGNGGGGGHETPNKGPLWEDIAAGMRRLGYARSSKRCKEKWENINKYFKKVKESSRSKQRPVDSKTCPYFHQLDKLYRTKAQNAAAASQSPTAVTVLAAVPLSSQTPAPHIVEHGPGKNLSNGNGNSNGMQAKASNGNGTAAANKLESKQDGMITKETTTEQHPQPAGSPMAPMNHNLNNYGNGRTEVMHDDMDDIDSMDDDDDFDSDDEDDAIGGGRNEQVQSYDIRFQSQQQQQQHQNTNGGGNPPAAPASAAAASGAAPAPFLAMVQ